MRYRPSLYARLILTLLGPLLLAMAAAWAIGVGFVTRTLEQRIEGQLRNAAAVLAAGGLPYTPEVLRRLAKLEQSDFVLLDTTGRVAASTSGTVGDAVQRSLSDASLPPWPSVTTRRLDAPVHGIAVYQAIEGSHDPRYAALVAVAPLGDAESAAGRAAWWLGIAMLGAAAVLGVVLLALVRNITRPLADLAAFAGRISAGERDRPLELPRADEIGALGEALNAMMTRLRRYEQRLASSSRMSALGEMSARLAHEIRNPLTGLKLHLQLLVEHLDASESKRVERLLTEVLRLELLVSTTLMLGADQALDRQPTDVGALVAEVLDLMGPSLSHRGIDASSACEASLTCDVDRNRLRQALLNLVVNAADAMPRGGRLRIGAHHDAATTRVRIEVEDSGPGVPDEVRDNLADAPTSTKPFGLGLGLTVCREVAHAHGGELAIGRSDELGGARIAIGLPSAANASATHSGS